MFSLADQEEFAKIWRRFDAIFDEHKDDKIDAAFSGCAGMACLDEKSLALYPVVILVDSVKASMKFLLSLVAMY